MSKQILSALKVITPTLVLSFGISYVYAWTAPTVTPPNGNVSAPINTSATAQTKVGWLKAVGGERWRFSKPYRGWQQLVDE